MTLMEEFEQLAHKRFERGLQEIRGGDQGRPFLGDPIKEGIEECVDGYNYSIQAWEDRRLEKADSQEICRLMFAAFVVFRNAQ